MPSFVTVITREFENPIIWRMARRLHPFGHGSAEDEAYDYAAKGASHVSVSEQELHHTLEQSSQQ